MSILNPKHFPDEVARKLQYEKEVNAHISKALGLPTFDELLKPTEEEVDPDWVEHSEGHGGVGYSMNCGYCRDNMDVVEEEVELV